MTFEEVLPELKKGKKAVRTGWAVRKNTFSSLIMTL